MTANDVRIATQKAMKRAATGHGFSAGNQRPSIGASRSHACNALFSSGWLMK